ncbi:patatin-like protein 6 [Ricinus communis]|uniref:Patatin n=1 Tax=Ricinus communis TaxID=3988 RepID=B9SUA7_RICCO|nr:patatin-like protein 6 [Ricinus communis]EEF32810.1 Patatin T5 precursor, putative [Ricinus communis]|eukprot:XP_002529576.1 patatin-like protein 6 [Ricinus communis]
MASDQSLEMHEPSIDTDKLSYEIFSILESKFLFGYDDQKLWIPKQISPAPTTEQKPENLISHPTDTNNGLSAIKNQRGKICILSIDSGGMKGILSGKALAYLEDALKTKSGNPDARIADYFDVAAGTGIGGIFTAMLFGTKDHNRPLKKADDTWRLLADHGKKIYRSGNGSSGSGSGFRRLFKAGSGSTGATTGLEKAMKEMFAEKDRSLTLKDTLKPVLIPCYDLSSTAPFLFSRADALETDSFDFRLWEVCRATSAEPGLFEPVQMRSVDGQTKCLAVDGGLAMSNPTAAAITHVLHNKQEFPFVRGVGDLLVLSLGSGQLLENSYDFDEVKNWRAKHWARPMARISGDGSADAVDQAVAMAFGQCKSSNYVRIQANGSSLGRCGPNVDTDSGPTNVKILIATAEEMLKQKNVESVLFGGKRIGEESNFEKLDWFAGELVLEHQRRSCRIAPTVAFKQAAASKPT